jgi:tRNA-modifying protein YgfZ
MVLMANSSFNMQVRRDRAVLAVEGPEAEHFLHNLVTADMLGLATGQARYASLLTPQGKILSDFFAVRTAPGYLLDCALSQRDDLVKRLTFYKLRAKVTIAARSDLEVGVSPDKPAHDMSYSDPRLPDLGWRIICAAGTLPEGAGYDAARIGLGLADSDGDIGSANLFPHEANFDQFGGISFTKGCYIGQEVVSRMEHRSTARNRILPVKFEGAAPPREAEIKSGGKVIGAVLSSENDSALALIRLDRLEDSTPPLLTEGVRTRVQKPSWVSYDVKET